MFSKIFIRLNGNFSTFYDHVPAPMFRREFAVAKPVSSCTITITALGLYDLFFNGERITKGYFAPYVSAPTDLVYYDTYDITESIRKGKNCVGVIVGTGFQNDVGRYNWRFDRAVWRAAVRFAGTHTLLRALIQPIPRKKRAKLLLFFELTKFFCGKSDFFSYLVIFLNI